jgi:hypothetical protein
MPEFNNYRLAPLEGPRTRTKMIFAAGFILTAAWLCSLVTPAPAETHGDLTATQRSALQADLLFRGVTATRMGAAYTVEKDGMCPSPFFKDRNKSCGNRTNRSGVPLHKGERVRVIAQRRHVYEPYLDGNGGHFDNYSQIRSIDRPDLPPVWIFDFALDPAK